MATLPSEFQSLAAELIDDEFAAFRKPLIFTENSGGTFDPFTGEETGGTTTTRTYQAIPQRMDINEWQGLDIAVTDQPVVYTRIDDYTPSVEQQCTFNGKAYQVKVAMYDSAAATVKLVLRGL